MSHDFVRGQSVAETCFIENVLKNTQRNSIKCSGIKVEDEKMTRIFF